MAEREPVLVCTAWPYANGSLHVGHLAGVYVPADVFARYQRLLGKDVLMISGTDAHGTPVTVRADEEHTTPAEVAARYHAEFLTYWRDLGVSYDLYTTTTTENHKDVVQDEFMLLLDKQLLYKASSTGFYDPVARRFLPDTYIEGECPYCHYPRARGNQCENCGRLLEPEDLINPYSRLNPDAQLERRATEHFYFDLPKLENALLGWARPMTHWRPNVYRFTINFLEGGLQPRAITRDLSWGVPLPPQVGPGWDDRRIYVWFEACSGYLSAAIEWARDIRGEPQAWERWWKDPACRQYYFIGKDNIPFHTVIWPAILVGRGDVILPYDVPANEYMNVGGQKASKSAGVGSTVPQLLEAFDPDAIRYYLIANAPETADTDYTEEDFVRRNNDELVATWGNLVHRTLSFMQRAFEGVVPEHTTDPEVAERVAAARASVEAQLDAVHLRAALREALNLARFGNEWFDRRAPWRQVREDRAAADATMGSLLDLINAAKMLFAPFLPHTSATLHALLGYTDALEARGWRFEPVPDGQRLPTPRPLFRKLELSAEAAA
ncbi:MAG: methionine--tRNA ligase [Chloroflexi bacterium]|nr:methionine--tRNA ligase [Chloroflexota bacterium]MBV9596125.1 methionine--tRNA ligase [Chloroflexota bacterium]